MKKRILAINPGSTSTKIAVYDNLDMAFEQSLYHTAEELSGYPTVASQFDFRKTTILGALAAAGVDIKTINAVIGRGGLLKPIPSGVYEVNDAMQADLMKGMNGEHASNLGGLIARSIATELGVRAFIADPVVVDELQDVARVTGLPGLDRVSIFHALNQKAIAREYAQSKGARYEDLNLIVAHLGGGISVGAHRKGLVVDVNNALAGEGAFSPERAGTLPTGALAALCFSGKYTKAQVDRMLCGQGGLIAHLGTNSFRDALKTSTEDTPEGRKAKLITDAMCYNVAKNIGSMAAVLEGKVDAIVITGGIAHNPPVTDYIKKMVGFIAPVEVRPGENELEALVSNALRVLDGSIEPKVYA